MSDRWEDPQFEEVGHVEGDFIVWDDGRPPTPLTEDLRRLFADRKPADAVCHSEVER